MRNKLLIATSIATFILYGCGGGGGGGSSPGDPKSGVNTPSDITSGVVAYNPCSNPTASVTTLDFGTYKLGSNVFESNDISITAENPENCKFEYDLFTSKLVNGQNMKVSLGGGTLTYNRINDLGERVYHVSGSSLDEICVGCQTSDILAYIKISDNKSNEALISGEMGYLTINP